MKKLLSLLLAAVMVLSVAACGSSSSAPAATTAAANTSASSGDASEAPKKGIDMTFTIFLDPASTDDPRSVVLKEIVDEYNATNAYGNTVTVESIHWSQYESQLIQKTAAGNGPDIVNAFSDQLMQHIEAGTIQPMTKYAKEFIAENPAYIHTAEKLTQADGEIYSLPWESRVTVNWYRTDIYDKAPETWDELLATAEKSTDLAMGFAVGLSDGSNGTALMETFTPWLRSAGGDLFDKDGKAIFNSEAGVKVVNFIKQLVEAGTMDKSVLNMAYDDVVDAFKSGTVYAMDAGTQRASTIKSSDLASNFASAPIAGVNGAAPAFVAGQTLAIGSQAKDPDMAWDFIRYFYTVENQKKWMSAKCMTVRTDVFDDPEIQAMDDYEEMKMWSEYATTGSMTFFPADYTELETRIAQAVQSVVFQGADAQTALDSVADWYNNK